ncbi:MAG: tetratricopeptide repeat protein [Rubrivivax sp.]
MFNGFEGNLKLDDEVEKDSALVIDSNSASRSITTQNLRAFGFGTVRQVSRLIDGRNMLESQRFNLVVCDYNFDAEAASGVQLLEELRRENMLPYSTVFVMIASEATYAQVAEAAESALDGYLIKPFSANSLGERIKEARQRKRVLSPIFEALEMREYDTAAQLCVERFESRGLYWLYAARIGAELLLRERRNEEAAALFKAVMEAKTVPWARLGVARAHFAEGDIAKARRSVEDLLEEDPLYADAHDVMGRVKMEMGQMDEARKSYERATSLTPECILRLQHSGTLSFYSHDYDTAADLLQQAWSIGKRSRLFDVLSMLLLAFIRYDTKQTGALQIAFENIKRFSESHPHSNRLRRFTRIAEVLVEVANGRAKHGCGLAHQLYVDALQPAFDLEAAMNVMSLLVRLVPLGFTSFEFEAIGRKIARRFAVNRATDQVILSAAMHRSDVEQWLSEALADTSRVAEAAVDLSLKGDHKSAVESLLIYGEQTCNARVIELAGSLLKRNRDKIEGIKALLDTQGVLSRRFCVPSTHIAGIRRSGRSSGGMLLKG